ncbi:MAG: NAD(+)/NADH kinase [Clostridiales Family XIII bacterium]|jgi:NAD+ kinase|nr:NAD(+)/NADH kinase [Clostridiales Family XIII bacterium]
MHERRISIIDYGRGESERICFRLAEKLRAAGLCPVLGEAEGAELIVVVGGDGSFLRTLERFGFPDVPFAGVNTGHLGFFQELSEADIDGFIDNYLRGLFTKQVCRTVFGSVTYGGGTHMLRGLNELVVKAADSRLAHFDIYIGENFIESFSGDGVVVSTPAGSTAYNYALGGSIVDPRLELLQLTPIAPVNTTAYRSFTSGIVLPPGLAVSIRPDPDSADDDREAARETLVAIDGNETRFENVCRIDAGLSENSVTLLRFKNYEFWSTVKKKLLTP